MYVLRGVDASVLNASSVEQRILLSRTNDSFTNASLVARLCGAATPRPLWIGNEGGADIARVVLYFHSDDTVRRAGFYINYYAHLATSSNTPLGMRCYARF